MKKLGIYLICLVGSLAWAQSKGQQPSPFVSSIDRDLTVRRIVLAPAFDNVSLIYANPLQQELQDIITAEKQWNIVASQTELPAEPTEAYDDNSAKVVEILKANNSDALLTLKITKGPAGISMKICIYTSQFGDLLSCQEQKGIPTFDLQSLRKDLLTLYLRFRNELPYSGLVISRRAENVTINLGSLVGLREGDELAVVQIVKLNRHPKFKFVVGHEKEILGKIRIFKTEETLSFAQLVYEIEPNAINVDSKVLLNRPIIYNPSNLTATAARPDEKIAFGEEPREWLPTPTPSFGKLNLAIGVGNFQANSDLSSSGSISAASTITPSMAVSAELWLNPLWSIQVGMLQALASTKNPRSGSSPSRLNFALSDYYIGAGYNLLLTQDFFGPKFQVLMLYTHDKVVVDDSSPTSFTTLGYTGFALGLKGSFPLPTEVPWNAGAELFYHLTPSLTERPVSSGAAKENSIYKFGIFGTRKVRENLNFTIKLDFNLYRSTFSGIGTRGEGADTISHSNSAVSAGVEYLF